jgi:DNA-directed RNA polymerase subunit RPC12/RpoP
LLTMQTKKYLCARCQEQFELAGTCRDGALNCPRCSSRDVREIIACSREIGPPPWKYICGKCQCNFSVKSPSGPDEAQNIRCPVCRSKDVKWLALVSESCPPGG